METGTFYMYDGSFQGFLSTIGEALEKKGGVAGIGQFHAELPPLFTSVKRIMTHRPRAERLWQKLERRSPALARLVYFSFLSETKDIELLIYNYLNSLLNKDAAADGGLADWRQRLESIARRVESEKRELERNLPFASSAAGIPCACASPASNVLPLLTRYYKARFAGQAWMIYDARRKYGVYWHNGQLEIIGIHPRVSAAPSSQTDRIRPGEPVLYESAAMGSYQLPKAFSDTRSDSQARPHPIRNAV